MPNTDVQAAGEALLTRRHALGLIAAATAAPTAAIAAPVMTQAPIAIATPENPDLIAAFDRLVTAHDEVAATEDALAWIVDEWKHVWPLAPEELLLAWNAQYHGFDSRDAERDIAGKFLFRDTSDLTKRLSPDARRKNPKTCFAVVRSDEAAERLDKWIKSTPKGRTERALARNQAQRLEHIEFWKQRLALAQDYERETARIRNASGIETAKQRVEDARSHVQSVAAEISYLPATTMLGLHLKAIAIAMADGTGLIDSLSSHVGVFGQLNRLVHSILAMGAQA